MKRGRWLELDNESHQPCDQCHGATAARYRVAPEKRWRCPRCFIGWLHKEGERHGRTPQV